MLNRFTQAVAITAAIYFLMLCSRPSAQPTILAIGATKSMDMPSTLTVVSLENFFSEVINLLQPGQGV